MKRKLNLWHRLGCFLTGWDKESVTKSSLQTLTKLNRITSAIFLISLIWFFVLYKFGEFYFKLSGEIDPLQPDLPPTDPYYIWRIFCGIIGVILVVQIERQVTLQISKSRTKWVRIPIAVLMALIGSVIFDQILFKDDIEIKRMNYVQDQVE